MLKIKALYTAYTEKYVYKNILKYNNFFFYGGFIFINSADHLKNCGKLSPKRKGKLEERYQEEL